MKKHIIKSLLVISFAFTIISCSSEPEKKYDVESTEVESADLENSTDSSKVDPENLTQPAATTDEDESKSIQSEVED